MKPYKNCDAAYADGRSDIPKGDPKYGSHLDRDGDGKGCDNPPAGFVARQESETSSGTAVPSGVSDRLPQTGPGEVTAIGAIVLTVGAVLCLAVRRSRTRFSA